VDKYSISSLIIIILLSVFYVAKSYQAI